MPTPTRETILAHYHYDPLDRQVDCTPFDQAAIQRYYCKTRLSTEVHGSNQHTILQYDDQLLAQQQRDNGKVSITLLVTDLQRSVLNTLNATQPHSLAYTPYGHRPRENGLLSLLGFNGERPDPVTGHYHLGNGYRQFNPVLMRFNGPDSWSPFGEGGINAYAHCAGDPVNRYDPTGHSFWSVFKGAANLVGRTPSNKSAMKSLNKQIAHTNKQIAKANKEVFKTAKPVDGGNIPNRRIGDTPLDTMHSALKKENTEIIDRIKPGYSRNMTDAFNINMNKTKITQIEKLASKEIQLADLTVLNELFINKKRWLLDLKNNDPKAYKSHNASQDLIKLIRQENAVDPRNFINT